MYIKAKATFFLPITISQCIKFSDGKGHLFAAHHHQPDPSFHQVHQALTPVCVPSPY
jgi:hypothetical protein